MSLWRSAALMIALAGLTVPGCRRTTAQVEPDDARTPTVVVNDETRERIARLAPDALIGRVLAVQPEARLAAIEGISPKNLRQGDALSFMDAEVQVLTQGVVVGAVQDTLHVRYSPPAADRREPVPGDLAVHFPSPKR